jgi:hypothetical protein
VLPLPAARGDLSELLLSELARDVHALPAGAPPLSGDPLADEDLHLSLYLCYELHYRGLPDIDLSRPHSRQTEALLNGAHGVESRDEGD